jgi:DNA polymerase-3 subunit alpha
VRYALAGIKNVGAGAMAAIVAERAANGPFKDVQDFAARIDASVINRRQLEFMVMAGCFDSLHPNRRSVFESIDLLLATAQNATEERTSSQVSLFGDATAQQQMNRRELKKFEEWPTIEKLNHERGAIGFYLSAHPLERYAPLFKKLGVVSSEKLLMPMNDKQQLKLAGILIGSKIRSGPRGRSAFLTLSDAEGQFEVAVFDESILNNHHALLQAGTALYLGIDVRISERGTRLLVQKVESLDVMVDGVRANALTIAVDDVSALDPLVRLLGERKDRGAKVELHVSIPDGIVKLALPGAYNVSAQQLMQLQSTEGLTAQAA